MTFSDKIKRAREMVQRLHERKIQVYAPDEIAAELGVQTAAFSRWCKSKKIYY